MPLPLVRFLYPQSQYAPPEAISCRTKCVVPLKIRVAQGGHHFQQPVLFGKLRRGRPLELISAGLVRLVRSFRKAGQNSAPSICSISDRLMTALQTTE